MQNLFQVFLDFRYTLFEGVVQTLYMTFVSVVLAYAIGLPLGVLLYTTQAEGIFKNKTLNVAASAIINMVRSIPFIIIMVVLIPFTRIIVGTAIGSTAAIVPLVIAAAPFIARMVETTLNELDRGVIDAARAMGASNFQIIYKVIIPENVPSLIRGAAITTIMTISLSAMAGAVGAGGLGRIAIAYGHQRFRTDIMLVTIVIIIVMVGIVQFAFNTLAAKIDRKK